MVDFGNEEEESGAGRNPRMFLQTIGSRRSRPGFKRFGPIIPPQPCHTAENAEEKKDGEGANQP